jgi:hypothetical protein
MSTICTQSVSWYIKNGGTVDRQRNLKALIQQTTMTTMLDHSSIVLKSSLRHLSMLYLRRELYKNIYKEYAEGAQGPRHMQRGLWGPNETAFCPFPLYRNEQ